MPDIGSSTDHGTGLARDVFVIVVTGALLGLGFNVMQRGSDRELPWIHRVPKIASLESLQPSSSATTSDSNRAAGRAPDTAGTPAVASRTPVPRPMTGAPAPAPATVTSRVPSPASTDSAAPPPASAGTPSPSADLPYVPITREPLEAQYATIKKLHDASAAVFVDARSHGEYIAGHIPGAINLPFDDVFQNPDLLKSFVDSGKPVVTYCGGGDCDLSRNLAFSLIEAGRQRVLVFTGGILAWQGGGNVVNKGSQP